jgi:hypothetical protein
MSSNRSYTRAELLDLEAEALAEVGRLASQFLAVATIYEPTKRTQAALLDLSDAVKTWKETKRARANARLKGK